MEIFSHICFYHFAYNSSILKKKTMKNQRELRAGGKMTRQDIKIR